MTFRLLKRIREIDARVILAISADINGTPEALPKYQEHWKRPDSPYDFDELTLYN